MRTNPVSVFVGFATALGLLAAGVAFAVNPSQVSSAPAPGSVMPAPDGFVGSMVFVADGIVGPPGGLMLMGPPAEDFARETLGFSAARLEQERAESIAFFQEQYGLDFSQEPMDGAAVFGGMALRPEIRYRVVSSTGAAVPAAGWTIHDAGFGVLMSADMMLHGTWGGPSGTMVPEGTMLLNGTYRIERSPGDPDAEPLWLSYHDKEPMIPNADGHFFFQCIVEHPTWGRGLVQGVWAPQPRPDDGGTQANTRTVATFPGLGQPVGG